MPTSERPTSARSNGPAAACPKAPTAAATATPSPPARPAIASRLRAVEQAYRTAIERGTAYTPPEPTRTPRSPELQADMQIDMEAEP